MSKNFIISYSIIVCIFIAIVARRTIILSKIDKKATELENNSNNFYMKTSFIDEKNYTASIERYIKDDVSKLVMGKKTPDGKNAKITEITYPEKRKMFTEVNGVKVMNEYNKIAK